MLTLTKNGVWWGGADTLCGGCRTQHHSSWASCALGGYYMSPLDFLLEHGGIFVSWGLWRTVDGSWPISICVG
jgi:hypothetical protein